MKTFKFRLYPNATQLRELERTLETHRRLYNQVLEYKQLMWDTERSDWSYFEQSKWFSRIRNGHKYYSQLNNASARYTMRKLDKAFRLFFKKCKLGGNPGYPRFKGKGQLSSFEFVTWRLRGSKIRLHHIGTMRVKLHRDIEGKAKIVRVLLDGDKWFIQFVCETHEPTPTALTKSVGVDVGLSAFATTSDGEQLGDSKILARKQKEVRKRQRALARCKKGSSRRKVVKRLARDLHAKIRHARRDMHHKVSRSLVNRYGFIAVENLSVRNMLKNHRLAHSIQDAGWSQFVQILTSKAESAGCQVISVDPRNTSQECSVCGQIVQKDLSVRIHSCDCGLVLDRDHNAARNILARALPEFVKHATASLN